MSDEDRWRWHAYDYGWRRVMLDDFTKRSPIDDAGEWFNASGAREAELFFRRKFNRPEKPSVPAPSHADAVRTNWRSIPGSQLTAAELALARADIERMAAEARRNIEKFAARSDAAFREKRAHYTNPGVEGHRRAKAAYMEGASPELQKLLDGAQ